MVVGGLLSPQPTVTAPPRLRPPGSQEGKGASFRLSHVKEALGQEAGLHFRNWKNLGAGGVALRGHLESAHSEGQGSRCQRVPSPWLAPRREGHLRGLLWASAPDPHGLHSASSHPCSEKAEAGVV